MEKDRKKRAPKSHTLIVILRILDSILKNLRKGSEKGREETEAEEREKKARHSVQFYFFNLSVTQLLRSLYSYYTYASLSPSFT